MRCEMKLFPTLLSRRNKFSNFVAPVILILVACGFVWSSAFAHAIDGAAGFSAAPDGVVIQKPLASDQLTFINDFAGRSSRDAVKDGKYRKLIHTVVPDALYHYHRDMPLSDALETVLTSSPLPA